MVIRGHEGYTITFGPIWCLAGDEREANYQDAVWVEGSLCECECLTILFRVDRQLPRDHQIGNHASSIVRAPEADDGRVDPIDRVCCGIKIGEYLGSFLKNRYLPTCKFTTDRDRRWWVQKELWAGRQRCASCRSEERTVRVGL